MRKTEAISKTTIETIIIIGIVIVLNILGQYFYSRADLTEDKIYTLADASKSIVQDLTDIVQMNVYISSDLPPEVQPIEQSVRDLLDEYRAEGSSRLVINYINPDDLTEDEKLDLAAIGIEPRRYSSYTETGATVKVAYFDIELKSLGNTEVIPAVPAERNLEYKISSTILKLMSADTPTIGFLMSHGAMTYQTAPMSNPYQQQQPSAPFEVIASETFLGSLYNLEEVDITNGELIADHIDTLVIAQPASEFSEREKYVIDQFIMRGGNLIVMGNSIQMDQLGMTNMANAKPFPLNDLLEEYGVKINDDLVADANGFQQPCETRVEGFPVPVQVMQPYPLFPQIVPPDGFPSESPITRGLDYMVLPFASSLQLLYDKIPDENPPYELIMSSPNAYQYPVPVNLACDQNWQPPGGEDDLKKQLIGVHLHQVFHSAFEGEAVPAYDTAGDEAPRLDTNEMITESPETSIVVIGNATFITNEAAQGIMGNSVFFMNLIETLTIGDRLIDIRTRFIPGRQLKDREILTPSVQGRMKFWGYMAVPIVIILVGTGRFYLKNQRKRLLQTLHEAEREEVQAKPQKKAKVASKYIGKTCPYCKSTIKQGDDIIICSKCGKPHHLRCWEENSGCGIDSCDGKEGKES